MKFIRNLVALFAVLQLVSNAHAFFGGYYGPGYGYGYGPGWGGGWGWNRGAAAADIAVGGATNLIGAAITADAIKKSNPEYMEYKTAQEERRSQEAQDRREARARGYYPGSYRN